MHTPSRSPLLPPYAAPFPSEFEEVRAAASAARAPFVPPTHVTRSAVLSAPVFRTPGVELEPELQTEQKPELEPELELNRNSAPIDESLPWIEAFAEDEVPAPTDTWAISDATVSIAHLAQDLTAASGITPPSPSPEAHAPWTDDEAWMDIMPALPNSGSADPAMDTSWARAFGEPPAPMPAMPLLPPPLPAGDAHAAAASLEAIARRLRSGELLVPGFRAEAGDAAALAATLASLLGART